MNIAIASFDENNVTARPASENGKSVPSSIESRKIASAQVMRRVQDGDVSDAINHFVVVLAEVEHRARNAGWPLSCASRSVTSPRSDPAASCRPTPRVSSARARPSCEDVTLADTAACAVAFGQRAVRCESRIHSTAWGDAPQAMKQGALQVRLAKWGTARATYGYLMRVAYAAFSSLVRIVAASRSCEAARSGWCTRISLRYATLTVSASAPISTPNIS